MRALRAARILASFLVLTLPLMPVQAALVRWSRRWSRHFPHWYHRQVCRLIGIRLTVEGEIDRTHPVLFVANHTGWLDIPILSAVAPVSFIAKKEVGGWPFVATLARLQQTVFVDRDRKSAVGDVADAIAARLAAGDSLVLFAEGTSSDGNRVLPFKTSLFAAVKPSVRRPPGRQAEAGDRAPNATSAGVMVQTLTVAIIKQHGLLLSRADRPVTSWYGDMEMGSHAWQLLKAGPFDALVRVGPPVPLDGFADRKDLARHAEREIRQELARILTGRPRGEPIEVSEPPADLRKLERPNRPAAAPSKWV
ncbi:MAG: lysophospholipid acyltransferase family protein [Hyphomicrobiaceae bacterium]|nr:lysophospholipid acyltransferase family protein [Hyphomicrobiaceae bacterium]